jgi:hypothetical protein
MNMKEKRAYLNQIHARYRSASKENRYYILGEFCKVCNYNRKYAIRLLGKPLNQPKNKPGPKPTYDPNRLLQHIKAIWFAADQPCATRLREIIPLWLEYYEQTNVLLNENDRKQLLVISSATINRMLKPVRTISKIHGLCGTKPGTLLKNRIEIKTHSWDVTRPGFIEADTVALCGNSLAGSFVWCVSLTDIFSGWTEVRAVWNKGSTEILKQIKNVENTVGFRFLGFDSDNGSEFMNHNLLSYFEKRRMPVKFTRSRPYKKNDNAHVEQKNYTHVRQLFGYDRFDNIELVALMNDLLANEWSQYQNHFLPSSKLINKTRVNSKYKKSYDKPQTPYARLIATQLLSSKAKLNLVEQHKKLNPFTLKADIEIKLAKIFELVKVTQGTRKRI